MTQGKSVGCEATTPRVGRVHSNTAHKRRAETAESRGRPLLRFTAPGTMEAARGVEQPRSVAAGGPAGTEVRGGGTQAVAQNATWQTGAGNAAAEEAATGSCETRRCMEQAAGGEESHTVSQGWATPAGTGHERSPPGSDRVQGGCVMPAGCRRGGGRSRQGVLCRSDSESLSASPQSPTCGRLRFLWDCHTGRAGDATAIA